MFEILEAIISILQLAFFLFLFFASTYYATKAIRWLYRHKHPAYAVALWFVISMPLIGMAFHAVLEDKSNLLITILLLPSILFMYASDVLVGGGEGTVFIFYILGTILISTSLIVIEIWKNLRNRINK